MLYITYTKDFGEITSEDHLGKIEMLSSEIDNSDEFFLASVSTADVKDDKCLDRKEKDRKRKRVAWIIALVSGILLLVSVLLVAISLYMSTDIDGIGTYGCLYSYIS